MINAPVYDELSRMRSKRLHASNYDGTSPITLSSGFTYLQNIDYTYNIRGWLTGINDPSSCTLQEGDNLIDMFSMKLTYETNADGGTAQFNGNIATMQWRTYLDASCLELQQYRFNYDGANRLTAADHRTWNGSVWITPSPLKYTESGITYDLNGNLKTYTRNGLVSGTSTFGIIDQLAYTYGDASRPDRLTQVSDIGGSSTKGFRYNSLASAYQYDSNGNMTQDNHKSLTIGYNFLNLPQLFTVTGTGAGTLTLTYTADGEKLTKVPSSGATQNYVGGIEYSGANLEAIYTSDGRCKPNGASAFFYEYTLKDHLGNARVNFRANGTTVTNLESFHYYPFGMQMEGIGAIAASGTNKYRYNGKEMNDDFGVNLLDYGMRWYDPALGRFPNVDPIIEKFAYLTPYNYASNNPVTKIDLYGLQGVDFNKAGKALFGSILGIVDAVIADATGYDLPNADLGATANEAFSNAQDATHAAMLVSGAGEAAIGTNMVGTGGAVALSGVGAAPGVITALVGAMTTAHGAFVANNAAKNLSESSQRKIIKDEDQGSYTNTHKSDTNYHGKGPKERAEQSAKEKAEKYNDPVVKIDWKKSGSKKQALIDEHKRLEADGGHKSPTNYNKRASPGKKLSEKDKENGSGN